MTTDDEQKITVASLSPEYQESFVATRMEYMGRIWQLDWNVEQALMRLSVVKPPDNGNNIELISIVSYMRPGHKDYVEGRSLNETLRAIILQFSDHGPVTENDYVSPWERHFNHKRKA